MTRRPAGLRGWIAALMSIGVLSGAGVIAAALAGRMHAALDSFAILAPYAGAALLTVALLGFWTGGRLRAAAAIFGGLGLLPLALVALDTPPPPPGPVDLRLLQHNLNFGNEAPDITARLADVDVALLQEVDAAAPALATLPAPWTAVICGVTGDGRAALVSRLPILDSGCLSGRAAWAQVETAGGPVSLVSIHLVWPWPARGLAQDRQIDVLVDHLRRLPRPVVVAGDFNQMPWSAAVARIAEAADAKPAGGLRATFVKKDGWVRLPIDHILLPDDWHARIDFAGVHGADHIALRTDLARPE